MEEDVLVVYSAPFLDGLDHRAVVARLNDAEQVKRGPGYWMLNTPIPSPLVFREHVVSLLAKEQGIASQLSVFPSRSHS